MTASHLFSLCDTEMRIWEEKNNNKRTKAILQFWTRAYFMIWVSPRHAQYTKCAYVIFFPCLSLLLLSLSRAHYAQSASSNHFLSASRGQSASAVRHEWQKGRKSDRQTQEKFYIEIKRGEAAHKKRLWRTKPKKRLMMTVMLETTRQWWRQEMNAENKRVKRK